MVKTSATLPILLVVTCSQFCSALFYTNSRENDYPRIGKRLELYEVLKGETSYPKYLNTNIRKTHRTKSFEPEPHAQSWDMENNLSSLKAKGFGFRLPITPNMQRETKIASEDTTKTMDIDEFLEFFKGIDAEYDNLMK